MKVSESCSSGSQTPFSLKRKVPPTTQLGPNPVVRLQCKVPFEFSMLIYSRTEQLYMEQLSISHCSVAVYWEKKRNFSEQARAKLNFQGFQTKSETLKNYFIYLLVVCISLRNVWNKKYFLYPCEPFSFGKHLHFSSPYS